MRKIYKVIAFIIFICLMSTQITALAAGPDWDPPTEPTAHAVYLVDPATGTVLYSKNPEEKVYPASITKLMTAILVAQKYKDNLNTVITVQQSDLAPLSGTGSSLMGLKAGEQITVEKLLYGMLLPSGNDAAMVLARAVGGDVETFVGMMNAEAKKLGCEDTHYVNPHGLQDPNQYTTAKDVYLIAKYAMSFDILAKIVDTSRYSFQTNLQHHTLVNINTMLTGGTYFYKYLLGIKTGSTSEAGSCLVSYATYNGSTYYCVVMDSTYDKFCVPAFADTKPLYQWAFSNFALKDIVDKGSVQATTGLQLAWDKTELQLVAGSQLNALIPAGTDPKTITIVPSTPESVKAPIKAGQKIGEASVEIVVNKKVIKNLGKVDLVASESIARSQPLYFVYMVGRFFSSIWFKLLSAALIILLVLFFFLSFLHNRRKKRRMRRKKIYRL